MDIKALSGEKLVAFKALLKEHDLDNRRMDIARLFAVSVCRIFWNDWKKIDAIDPTAWEDGEGYWNDSTGQPRPHFTDEQKLVAKWEYRAGRWSSWHYDDIRHVRDWFYVSVAANAHWLHNRDSNENPKKLMKCGTLKRLNDEADRYFSSLDHRESSTKRREKEIGPEDETLECDLGAGYRLIRLLTPKALDSESARMGHCIGWGAYDKLLDDPEVKLLSIRNERFEPVATLEVRKHNGREYVLQFSGPRNAKPEAHLKDLIAPLEYGTLMQWYADKDGWEIPQQRHDDRYVDF